MKIIPNIHPLFGYIAYHHPFVGRGATREQAIGNCLEAKRKGYE